VPFLPSGAGVAGAEGYNCGMNEIAPSASSGAVDYPTLVDALKRLGFVDDASEYHGALCGALCVLEPDDVPLLSLLDAEEPVLRHADPEAQNVLRRLSQQSFDALLSSQMSFEPLMPDDDAPLALRVQALASWCQGFLYGLASQETIELRHCSVEAREIIQDLGQFTQAGASVEDNSDLEEGAYAELVEYLRVGAQLVFMELHPKSPEGDLPTLH